MRQTFAGVAPKGGAGHSTETNFEIAGNPLSVGQTMASLNSGYGSLVPEDSIRSLLHAKGHDALRAALEDHINHPSKKTENRFYGELIDVYGAPAGGAGGRLIKYQLKQSSEEVKNTFKQFEEQPKEQYNGLPCANVAVDIVLGDTPGLNIFGLSYLPYVVSKPGIEATIFCDDNGDCDITTLDGLSYQKQEQYQQVYNVIQPRVNDGVVEAPPITIALGYSSKFGLLGAYPTAIVIDPSIVPQACLLALGNNGQAVNDPEFLNTVLTSLTMGQYIAPTTQQQTTTSAAQTLVPAQDQGTDWGLWASFIGLGGALAVAGLGFLGIKKCRDNAQQAGNPGPGAGNLQNAGEVAPLLADACNRPPNRPARPRDGGGNGGLGDARAGGVKAPLSHEVQAELSDYAARLIDQGHDAQAAELHEVILPLQQEFRQATEGLAALAKQSKTNARPVSSKVPVVLNPLPPVVQASIRAESVVLVPAAPASVPSAPPELELPSVPTDPIVILPSVPSHQPERPAEPLLESARRAEPLLAVVAEQQPAAVQSSARRTSQASALFADQVPPGLQLILAMSANSDMRSVSPDPIANNNNLPQDNVSRAVAVVLPESPVLVHGAVVGNNNHAPVPAVGRVLRRGISEANIPGRVDRMGQRQQLSFIEKCSVQTAGGHTLV